MSKADYTRALDAAVREYERALADQSALESRVGQLRQSILHLTKLCGYEATVPFGLTDACRLVLQNAPAPLSAVAMRDRLMAIGFDLDRYSNPLAAVHTTLKRLAEAGEAEPAPDESSRTAYQRVRKPQPSESAEGLVGSRSFRRRRGR